MPEHIQAEESLIGNINEPTGQMRLVKFTSDDPEFIQYGMRPDTQGWDIGGIQALSMRVPDLEKIRHQLHAIGWQATSAPSIYRFAELAAAEWVPCAINGSVFSFVERISPPLTGWPHMKRISRIFNSSQIVRDVAVT